MLTPLFTASGEGDFGSAVTSLLERRFTPIFTPPRHWREPTFPENRLLDRTISNGRPVLLRGESIWGGRPVEIKVYSEPFGACRINAARVDLETVVSERSSFAIGGVGVAEHALAVTVALGLTVSFLVDGRSFPLYRSGIYPLLDRLLPQLQARGEVVPVTVQRPVLRTFRSGGYGLLLPDNGSRTLIIDHQIEHLSNCLGRQRIVVEIAPPVFAYLAKARTNAYGLRGWLLERWRRANRNANVPRLGLNWEKVTCVLRDRIANSREVFDHGGSNHEFICHEVVDKCGSLGLLPGRFVGTYVTFRTSHAQDIEVMRAAAPLLIPA